MTTPGPERAGGAKKAGPAARSWNTERLSRMGTPRSSRQPGATRATAGSHDRPAGKSIVRAAARATAKRGVAHLASALGTPATGAVVRGAITVVEKVGWRRLAIAAIALPAAVCCLGSVAVAGVLAVLHSVHDPLAACYPVGAHEAAGQLDDLHDLDDEQWAHGELIVRVGVETGAPPRAWVIAVATAMQESNLRNLPHLGDDNDHDSLGLFQQRPSAGWGTPEQILDPEYAAAAFYERLLAVNGWQEMPLTRAAQEVQVSAHPDAYARHEPRAVALVDAVTGGMAVAAAFDDSAVRCSEWFEVNAAGWTRPAPGPVWSGFRTADRPEHYGVDIGAPRGTAIRAAADGRVIHVACDATLDGRAYGCDVDGSPTVSGCGWYLDIQHAGGVVTRYCHLQRHPEVTVGEQVAAGQRIGAVGSSGRSSGPHLHFEIELRTTARADSTVERRQTDPAAFLAARGVVLECLGSAADCQPVHGDRVRQR